jgi:hypothetical protein
MNTGASRRGRLVQFVLRALGLAMGVAVVVLNILGAATPQTSITLLGIGLTALGLALLDAANEP